MTSHRHNPEAERSARDDYLDAARACILDVGWRRTTLTEVARRSGVSRMTIYRAWSDMQQLLGDLMTREWGELVTATTRQYDAATAPTPELIADGVVTAVGVLRDNELFVRILELDPELILPYLLSRRGRSQELIIEVLTATISAGQQAGTVRDGNPVAIARALVLAAHGFVFSAHTMTDPDPGGVDGDVLTDELHLLVTRMLSATGERP